MKSAALLAIFLAGAAQASDATDMSAAASGFYGVYKSAGLSDGIPNSAARARYEPFITPALDRALIDADAAQQRFAKSNKDAPPLLEGDLFTSHFEGANSATVGACSGDAAKGSCAIHLHYDNRRDKPLDWTDTLYLVKTGQGWRVNDIGYGGNWPFGNQGRLHETLSAAVSMAQ